MRDIIVRNEVAVIPVYIILSVVSDYSMIVATRPDPTVRPPSRL